MTGEDCYRYKCSLVSTQCHGTFLNTYSLPRGVDIFVRYQNITNTSEQMLIPLVGSKFLSQLRVFALQEVKQLKMIFAFVKIAVS